MGKISCCWLLVTFTLLFNLHSLEGSAKICAGQGDHQLTLSHLYWSNESYRRPEDQVTFDLCLNSNTSVNIALHNGTVIGSTYVNKSETDYGETLLRYNTTSGIETFIFFTCQMNTLGKPMLLDQGEKRYFFEWRTLLVCVLPLPLPLPQMPCYIYTSSQQLIDLTDLTKTDASYVLSTKTSDKLYINVCGNVKGCDGPVCSQSGAEATLQTVSVMNPATKLTLHTSKLVQLNYTAAANPNGCSTLINFICPNSPLQATPPAVTSECSSENNVPWTIDWYTTHACPISHLVAKHSCQLSSPQYGVNIDLSPLNNDGKTFTVKVDPYEYEIGVCGTKVTGCALSDSDSSRGDTVSCQKKSSEPAWHKSLGMSEFAELRYVDDALTMKLYKGETCRNNFQRETIIRFYCSQDASIGEPVFDFESNCSYHFNWTTSYACDQSLPCTYQPDSSNNSNIYDFSSLTKHDSSASWSTKTDATNLAYINVCHPVEGVDGCDPTAAVCRKSVNSDKAVNLGQASTMEFGLSSGSTVSLTYSNGDPCGDGTKRHSTTIYFMCDTGGQLAGPQWNEEDLLACYHTIRWATPAACGNTPSVSGDCTVTSRGFRYDFSSITSLGSDIQVSPCAPLLEGCGEVSDATVCQGQKTLSREVPKLVVENDQVISTSYKPEDGQKNVIVRYNCDESAEVARVTQTYTFDGSIKMEVNTTLSCTPKAIDCRPSGDDGHIYDLRAFSGRNYMADSEDHMQYFFSVCTPLNRTIDTLQNCTGGPISACQVTSSKEYVNLGYATSNPVVISKGLISITYVNGQLCGHGNKTPRQTTLTLNCKDIEKKPQMRAENDDCDYEIWWDTPKACPLEKAVIEKCVVIKDGVKFDLSSLNETRSAYDGKSSTYYLTVCNHVMVHGDSSNCQTAGVCKVTGSTLVDVGNVANREIHADGGNTEIVYTKGETKSIITLVCGAVKSGEVRFIRSSSDDKLAYFEWETSLVCAPVEVTCSGTFPNGTAYDLSSLISHGSNYVGHNSYKDLYYINICHRLTATDDAVNCPAGAAACMVSGSGSDKRYISLGQLDPTQPVLTNLGTALFVQYKNGDVCASNSSYNWSSLIMFKCNPDKKVLGEVEVARKSDDCRQDFLIETAAACFDKATVTTPAPTMSCENIPGLDTTELKKQYEIDADEHTYYLNFCGASGEKATCNSTSNFGVCQVSKNSQQEEVLAGLPTTSATQVNERIIFNYIDGNKCMHDPNQSPRNVVLEIFCSQYAEVDSVPVFHRETVTDCTYYMYWPRVELCRTDKIVCTVTQDGHIMDLSALSGRTHYAQASPALRDYQDKLYQISVCKPLPLSSSNKCPGAAVCETDNSNLEIYKDLGFLSDGLRVMDGEDGHLQLIYNTTISCSGNSSQTVSSVITFSCGDTMGSPVLDEADGCTYSFTWQTSEACHADNSAPTADCKITSLTNGRVIDLSPFKGQTYKPSGYSLRVCEGLPSEDLNGCPAGTAVCQAGVAKGSVMSPLQFHGHDILLRYNSSTACDKGGTWSTTIEFVCDITVGKGEPKLMWTYDHSCELLFQWNTNHVCNPDCQLSHLGLLYDFSHLTLHTDFYQVSADNFEFYINICKDLPLSKAGSEGTCVSVVKDGQTYALAQTSTLVSTYNEKGNLTLSYNGSDSSICGSSGQMPHVLFQLSCSNTQGRPTFKAEDTGTCTFVFQWSTYVACADDDRSAIQVTNGQFVDSISQLTYSIAALLNRRVDIMDGEYTYSLSLNQVLPNEESLGPNCNKGDTRVCQYKPEFSRSLGQQITSYYYQDEQLQMVLNSTSVCGRVPNTYVQTIVNFVCNDKVPEDSNPEFRVETTSCHYLFEWHTPIICEPIQPAQPLSKNGNVATAVSIVAALLLLIALIVGIIIYKKKHRRRWDGVYEYSGVAQDDDTTGLISANRGSTPRFYDDDDEDMII
ncbi:cation-independent mannose-6-phosphate receptor-like [Watersipora subatra]|uniref:cation-independent mannose-6-phosphate receptor-like n=1 Tax=Watersipora subatra TaxID=2589382 RepID=UPI00355C2185